MDDETKALFDDFFNRVAARIDAWGARSFRLAGHRNFLEAKMTSEQRAESDKRVAAMIESMQPLPQYPALFEPIPGCHTDEQGQKIENSPSAGFLVSFPDLPGGLTDGETEEEAMLMAGDCLLAMIEMYIEKGKPLPQPGNYEGPQYRMITPKLYERLSR